MRLCYLLYKLIHLIVCTHGLVFVEYSQRLMVGLSLRHDRIDLTATSHKPRRDAKHYDMHCKGLVRQGCVPDHPMKCRHFICVWFVPCMISYVYDLYRIWFVTCMISYAYDLYRVWFVPCMICNVFDFIGVWFATPIVSNTYNFSCESICTGEFRYSISCHTCLYDVNGCK